MSLEAALAENTAAVRQLIAVLQSGALPAGPAPASAPPATGRGSRKATAETSAAGTPTPPARAAELGANVNTGTTDRYFHIERHRTATAVRPGEVIPSIDGLVEINAEEYAALKAKYQSPVPPAGVPAAGPAGAPAQTAPAASTASTPTSAPSPAPTGTPAGGATTLDGPAITAKCQALHKAKGNDGLLTVLQQFGVTRVPDLVTKTDQYPAIAAALDGAIAPPPAAAPAAPNLFG